jgi:hypothetical protein
MPMTNAERQAAYRERHLGVSGKSAARMNSLISLDAAVSLDALSRCYGLTKRAVLEALLDAAAATAEAEAIRQGKSASAFYRGTIRLDPARLLRNARDR